jgi:hypothetical protein
MINDLLHVANAIWVGAGTPVASQCIDLAAAERWEELATLSVDPSDYTDWYAYKVDAQCVGLLKKCGDLDTGVDLEGVAKANFLEAESLCCHTNAYFSRFINGGPFVPGDARRLEFISKVREEIRYLVGAPPKFLDFRLGKGSTLSDIGTRTTVPHKFCSEPTITPSALHVVPMWAHTAWGRNLESEMEIRLVEHDHWLSVLKDALKNRGISVQPSVNAAAQLAVGTFFRRRLKNRGFDLDTMQDLHRLKACIASMFGDSATVDLRNASDTEAKRVIQLLFTHEWFFLLNSLRTPFTQVELNKPDDRLYLEKFSGMGNGYTFELETIVFLAICHAVCGRSHKVSVYGDDIIVPTEHVGSVLIALRFFGFQANTTKTFVKGAFRESCGGDYFDGHAVRPHFQKFEPTSPQDWIALANGLRRVWLVDGTDMLDSVVTKAWHLCLEKIPVEIRACRGPEILGDIVIHDAPRNWLSRRKDSIRYFRAWLPYTFEVVEWARFPAGAVLAAALYGVSSNQDNSFRLFGIRTSEGRPSKATHKAGIVPREGVTGYRIAWVPYS